MNTTKLAIFQQILTLAQQKGYAFECLNFETACVSVTGAQAKIIVYVTGSKDTFTVASCLNHPRKGCTQLIRKHVSEIELELILDNPRIHLGKGYYHKKKRQKTS